MSISLAVLGSPIGHSLSPALHRAALELLGLEGSTYDRFDVTADALAEFLDGHDHVGYSLTMPLKTELVELAGRRGWEIDSAAQATWAANTLIRHAGGVRISNTDVLGIVYALRDPVLARRLAGGAPAHILGGGATAGSAVAALARLGATDVSLFVRNPERTAQPVRTARAAGVDLKIGSLATWRAGGAAVVVSTLPGDTADAYASSVDVPAGTFLLNAAYSHESALTRAFAAAGAVAIGGETMLIGQALEQFLGFVDAGVSRGLIPQVTVPPKESLAAAMRAAL